MPRLPAPHYLDLQNGAFKETSPADLATLFQALPQSPHKNNLVIHFHGGLVNRESGHKSGLILKESYEAAGAYPIFFIWNSGIKDTLWGNLQEISQEKIFRRLVRRVGQLVLGKMGEEAGQRGGQLELMSLKELPADLEALEQDLQNLEKTAGRPVDWELTTLQEKQVRVELERDRVLNEEAQKIANGLRDADEIDNAIKSRGGSAVRGSTETLMSPEILRELADEGGEPGERGITVFFTIVKHTISVVGRVLSRYRKGRDHGLYTTIVEEILRALYIDNAGALVWKLIKKDTADAFGGDPRKHGGTAFVEQLRQAWHADLNLTLVGHSTGAIYIGHLLQHLDAVLPPEARVNVVFLAAASSFGFINDRLDVFRRRVRHFHNFGLSDERERTYWEFPGYRGSLLYLVSGILEPDEVDMPLVGMERYWDASGPYDRPDIKNVMAMIADKERVWSLSEAGAGRECDAKKHGDFDDNDEATRRSLTFLIGKEFGNAG